MPEAYADDKKGDTKPKLSGQALNDFLDKAQKKLKLCIDSESHNRIAGIEDQKFINGEQWDAEELRRRNTEKRPALVVNQLNKYRNQLVGEQRNSRLRIKVRPVSTKSDINIARIYEGLVADIEYQSNYQLIYNFACDQAIESGYGAWEVCTRYTEDNPFLQEIYLKLHKNAMLCYLDPDDEDDPKFGFIITKINKKKFEEDYPNASKPDDVMSKGQGLAAEHWYDKDTYTIAKYFVKESEKKKMALMQDGTVLPYEEAKEKESAWKKTLKAAEAAGKPVSSVGMPTIVKTRDMDVWKIRCYKITSKEILEEYSVPGPNIPIVMLTGRERNIEGKKYIRSYIHDAKDPARMFNYWNTAAAEQIALQPKAPWQATAKQIEGYENDYLMANVRNIPVLKYKHDPQAATAKPERAAPPQMPSAVFAAIQDARQNISDSLGMYNRDYGDKGPEVSGSAIRQSRMPTEVGNADIYFNYKMAVEKTGRIIVGMIPEVYDSQRDVRIRNVDDTESFVPVNTTAQNAMGMMQQNPARYTGLDMKSLGQVAQKNPTAQYNNLKIGRYGVVVDSGPTTATQRQEASEAFLQLLQTPLGSVIERVAPDLVIENFDFLKSDEFSRRLKKILPPGIIDQKPGDPPVQPPPPSPQVQLLMQKTQTESEKQKTQRIALQVQMMKLYKEAKETDTEIRSAILQVLAELHAPEGMHPSDMQGGMAGGMPQQMPQMQ